MTHFCPTQPHQSHISSQSGEELRAVTCILSQELHYWCLSVFFYCFYVWAAAISLVTLQSCCPGCSGSCFSYFLLPTPDPPQILLLLPLGCFQICNLVIASLGCSASSWLILFVLSSSTLDYTILGLFRYLLPLPQPTPCLILSVWLPNHQGPHSCFQAALTSFWFKLLSLPICCSLWVAPILVWIHPCLLLLCKCSSFPALLQKQPKTCSVLMATRSLLTRFRAVSAPCLG